MKLKTENMNSIALALLVLSGLTGYLCQYLRISSSFLTMNMIVVIIAVGLSLVQRMKRKTCNISTRMGVYVIYLTLMVIWGIYIKQSDYSILQFIMYVLSAAIISSGDFKIEYVLRILTFSSLLFVPFYDRVFQLKYVTLNQANMGTMYKLLNIVVAGIIHFTFFRQGQKKVIWLGYVGCAVLLVGILSRGNRGVVLSVLFLLVVCFLNGHASLKKTKSIRNKKRFYVMLIAIITIVIGINFNSIILWAFNTWGKFSSSIPSFLVKMNKYIMLNDTSNGRNEVYEIAFKLISQHPIFGIGIENFGKYYTVNYPHNFVLQLLIEGGPLFLCVPLMSSLYLLFYTIYEFVENRELRACLVFMISLMLPRFLVSLDIWTYYEFWIPVFFMITRIKQVKKSCALNTEEV